MTHSRITAQRAFVPFLLAHSGPVFEVWIFCSAPRAIYFDRPISRFLFMHARVVDVKLTAYERNGRPFFRYLCRKLQAYKNAVV